MFLELGLSGWSPQQAAVVLGLVLGLAFGVLAEASRFCLRRALAGDGTERAPAFGVWALALAVALGGTTALVGSGIVDFAGHRLAASRIAVSSIVAGGMMFGAGMVLARGCASRLTVLAATGNLRALVALLAFAVMAHAVLKGALAPARVWVQSFSIDVGTAASLAALPLGGPALSAILVAGLLTLVARSGASARDLAMGGAIGALVPLGWLGTGYVLSDAFAPLPLESLGFTSAASEGLFWWIAGTAVAPTFGVGLLGGVLAGSFLSALAGQRLQWTGFTAGAPVARYLAGGTLMGVGGVLAGGCTVGAGLSGVSTLSLAAMLALAAIATGAVLTRELTTGGARRGASMVAAE